MASLKGEFPELIELNEKLPNRMKFIHQSRNNRDPGESKQQEYEEIIDDNPETSSEVDVGKLDTSYGESEGSEGSIDVREDQIVLPRSKPQTNLVFSCDTCGKTYRRNVDLLHHNRTVHNVGNLEKLACNICGRLFLRRKDLRVHELGKKCYSRRGRRH